MWSNRCQWSRAERKAPINIKSAFVSLHGLRTLGIKTNRTIPLILNKESQAKKPWTKGRFPVNWIMRSAHFNYNGRLVGKWRGTACKPRAVIRSQRTFCLMGCYLRLMGMLRCLRLIIWWREIFVMKRNNDWTDGNNFWNVWLIKMERLLRFDDRLVNLIQINETKYQ